MENAGVVGAPDVKVLKRNAEVKRVPTAVAQSTNEEQDDEE